MPFRFAAALLCLLTPVFAQNSVTRLLELKEQAKIRALDDKLNGVLGVATIDLTSGRVLSYNADAVFPTASSIKIAIMIELFRAERAGKFHFSDTRTLRPQDDAGGSSGPLAEKLKAGPVKASIQSLMEDMIVYSDNTATNQCIDVVGMEAVNALLDRFGFHATRLRRKMMDSAAAAHGRENVSTPMELARLLELIYREKAANPEDCRQMLAILKRVKANMRPVIPAEIEVAAKPGDLDGVRCEVGLVLLSGRPFIVNAMSTYLDEGANPVGDVTKIVFEYFRKVARSNEVGRRLN
jgi:beta-lactamase class A